jgi:hypothetical protein
MSVRRVVIVGPGHSYHVPPNGPAADEFRAFLSRICHAHQVQAIAEELSQEALAANWKVAKSLCHELADAMRVSHRYCDLNTAQRNAAGVRAPQDDQLDGIYNRWSPEKTNEEIRNSQSIRERHWKEKLLNLDKWPVLFVCGADHVLPFQRLLSENGLSVEIAAHDWEPSH